MDVRAFYEEELNQHASLIEKTKQACWQPFIDLVEVTVNAIRNGNKIIFFGNGGSAADAQHLAAELNVRYIRDRAPISAIAMTTDPSAITAIGNDFGFPELFARQVRSLGRPGDVAIGISTSGNSKNVVRGLETAQSMGIIAAGFAGKTGGEMMKIANPLLVVPSDSTARIQEMHITLGHMLCATIEKELGLVE